MRKCLAGPPLSITHPEGRLAFRSVRNGLNTKHQHSCVSLFMVLGEAGNVTLLLLSLSGMFHDLDLITQEMTHP